MTSVSINRLAERIAEERDPATDDVDLTMVGRVRRRLFRGEVLTPKIVVTEIGGSNGLLGQVMFQLETLGFEAVREPDEAGLTTYRLGNPDYQPTDADYERLRKLTSTRPSAVKRANKSARRSAPVKASNASSSSAAVTRAAATAPSPPQLPGVELPPLPDIGQPLTVYALALNEDGSITVGLRNGTRQWLTNIVGQSER